MNFALMWRSTVILLLMASVLATPLCRAETFDPDQLRAPFLYHIARLTHFLPQQLPSQHIHFCFLETPPYIHWNILRQQSDVYVHERKIELIKLNQVSQLQPEKCQLLFVSSDSENGELFNHLRILHDDTVTIGESMEFVHQGGMMSIIPERGKMKIYFNRQVYENSPLRFSSRLLKHVKFR